MAGKGRRDNSGGINIGVRSFLIAIGIIFILMVATYILTLVVPGGEYARVQDASGNMVIDTEREASLSGSGSCLLFLFSEPRARGQ